MLKIKDDVDLKELEKFGFEDFGVGYKKYGILGEQYFIHNGDRKIKRIHPYSLREEATEDEVYDLIQARISRESRGVKYERRRDNKCTKKSCTIYKCESNKCQYKKRI